MALKMPFMYSFIYYKFYKKIFIIETFIIRLLNYINFYYFKNKI